MSNDKGLGNSTKQDLYFTRILLRISQGLDPHNEEFVKKLGLKNKTNIQYYIGLMKKKGYIGRDGSEWIINQEAVQKRGYVGQEGVGGLSTKMEVRGHGFGVSLRVPKNLQGWNKRMEKLQSLRGSKSEISFRPVKTKLSYYPQIVVDGWKVDLRNNTVVFWAPKGWDVWGHLAPESFDNFYFFYKGLVRRTERLLHADFTIKGKHWWRVFRSHYALVNNGLARQREGKPLYVYDTKGLWFVIDFSAPCGVQLDEAETVRSGLSAKGETNVQENVRWQRFCNSVNSSDLDLEQVKAFKLFQEEISKTFMDSLTALAEIQKNNSQAIADMSWRFRDE